MNSQAHGFTRSLSYGLFHRWEPKARFMYWTAYLDESGTHKQSPILIMGMALSTAERWEAFEVEWNKILDRENLPWIHYSELVNRKRPRFDKYNSIQAQALLDECKPILNDHVEMSSVSILRKRDYDRFYKDRVWERGPIRRDTALGVLFRSTVSWVPRYLIEAGVDASPTVNFVYERGVKNAGDIIRLYDAFKTLAPPEFQACLGTLTFAGKGEARGLEAADAMSFGALQTERPEHREEDDHGIEQSSLVQKPGAPPPTGPLGYRLAVGEEILTRLYEEARLAAKERRMRAYAWRANRRGGGA